ncbi:probable methyltransferase-like protein 24 isoform X1 [Lepisosteus oculatus]|uniref:probable methyltransferase-like protein 24 isoform X1 n=1 Tax=Lepisosteus oculatus TaxID=7918 RepID=UPI0007400E75|nr:PREDICTED: methyltransferase-like protein 24 isoform X1 [Lepisosteus oculatus]
MRPGRRLYCALMRTCLVIVPLLLLLQIFIAILVPGNRRFSEDTVAFTIISIENTHEERKPGGADSGSLQQKNVYPRGAKSWRTDFSESEPGVQTNYSPHIYEDENELMTRQGGARRQVELQPWAAGQPSFTAEVERLLMFITTPQVYCARELLPGKAQAVKAPADSWVVCLEGWFLPMTGLQSCVAYSFSMDQKDEEFVSSMASLGCEVHQFDPGRKSRQTQERVQHHQMWLDWRNPRTGHRKATPRKLSAIMQMLGHRMVEIVQADLESAEWRIVESWVLDGTLTQIQQLVLTVHLQWAGFEVGGSDAEVVRFWYSLMKELHTSGYRLLHSARGPGQAILHHALPNASSSYMLSWVNTRWSY